MEYFCFVLRRHLIKKIKDVDANALFNSFFSDRVNRSHANDFQQNPCA